jgi:uncharacterized damage-inducible protein DinB
MTTPETNDPVAGAIVEVLNENERARSELLMAIEGLPEERQREVWFGEWSVREIVSHLFSWQNGFAHALERMAEGERPEIPGFDPRAESGEDAFNAEAASSNQHLDWADLLAHLRAAKERHEAAVRNLVGHVDAERYEPGRTARRLSDSATHDREHLPAILEWRRRVGV